MSESQGGAGRREVAYRLFAAEFDDADFSYSESDEERAPNYVVTPTGARVNRVFVVGVLTEIETVSEDYLRARVVDPTGPFVVYAGQYQPDALAFLERADPPTFVAVTGKARTYQPDDSDRVFTSIRPESMSTVEAATRDRWVVQTAEQTVDRVARMAEAKQSGLAGDGLRDALGAHGVDEGLADGIALALDHYGTTGDYLAEVREMALDSARVVAGEIDEAESLALAPDAGTDDAVAGLVERPIDADAAPGGDDSTEQSTGAAAAPDSDEPDEAVAEAGAGDGSAVGTAESTGQRSVGSESTTETPDVGESAGAADEDAESTGAQELTGTQGSGGGSVDEPEPAADATDEPTGGTTAASESAVEAQGPTDPETAETTDATANPDSPSSGADDLEDFEPEFDLDEDEREEIEAEFGTEFQSGSEVDEPGEADMDVPDPGAESGSETEPEPEPETDPEPEPTGDRASSDESGGTDDPAPESDLEPDDERDEAADEDESVGESEPVDAADVAEPESAGDVDLEEVDLEDAAMDAMTDLDEGDGVTRDEVVAAVVDRTGADPGDVEDAIQDALMGGRCYEPDDETLKPI